MDMLEEASNMIFTALRPQAVSLINTFENPDNAMMSAIGNNYGDIYETHLRWAKESRMNNKEGSIPDGWNQYMMPIL